MKIVQDGNMYLVCADNFINLQESEDYFFITEEEFERYSMSARDKFAAFMIDKINNKSKSDEWDLNTVDGVEKKAD